MNEVYSTIKNNRDFKNYSYSITFDDGFYNNYKIAAPILKKRKLDATFYLTTSFIDKKEMYEIDKIEHMIEKQKKIKFINIFNKKFKIENNKKSKIKFLTSVRNLAKRDNVNCSKLVSSIKNQLRYNYKLYNLNNILDKKMNWKQVKKLSNCKYFTIGGHTVNHPILSFLNYSDAKAEINNSINIIEKKAKIKVEHFSYPEGLNHTYGEREIKLLKKRGIKICPSAEFGINNKNVSLFNLKRIFVNS